MTTRLQIASRTDLGLICPHQIDLRTTYCHECAYARFREDKRRFEETAVLLPLPYEHRRSVPPPPPDPWAMRDLCWGLPGLIAATLCAVTTVVLVARVLHVLTTLTHTTLGGR